MLCRFGFCHFRDQSFEIGGRRGDLDPAIGRAMEHQDDIAVGVGGAMQMDIFRLESEVHGSGTDGDL